MWNQRQAKRGLAERQAKDSVFLNDVRCGLSAVPPRLPCKYFYDRLGSQLFDQICGLKEYYPARAELQIMQDCGPQMAAVLGPRVMLIEYGSGSSVKTRVLLDQLVTLAAYVPVDISCEHLRETARDLSGDYPHLEILPVCQDFTGDFALPDCTAEPRRRVIYFPGSTIGNFAPGPAKELLRQMRRQCGSGGGLLIGVDLRKDPAILEAAYNDGHGVTAAFNLNLLARINRELAADFCLDGFQHRACYNAALGRIEMYLISRSDQTVVIAGEAYHFAAGTRICTEHSHKYTVQGFAELAAPAGWQLVRTWTDPRSYFAVLALVADP
jgi:dimethylhistidine N-methyltransferase